MLTLAAIAHRATDSGDSESSHDGFFSWLFSSDSFHAPTIQDFNPPAILFEDTIFEFNRITFVRVVAVVVLLVLFWLGTRKATIVPGRGQSMVELVVDFVKKQIVDAVIGEKQGKRFLPILTTVFVAIAFFNLTGVIPFLNIAGTSMIGLPLVMALWVYVMYLSAGIKEHGLLGFLKISLFPPGPPWWVYFLLTPVEILQVFILRPATLALRLAANMIAGHLMLVLTFAATHFFLLGAGGWMSALGVGTLIAGGAVTLFEIFVALLQAYIFTMLSAVYINMSISHEH